MYIGMYIYTAIHIYEITYMYESEKQPSILLPTLLFPFLNALKFLSYLKIKRIFHLS